MLEPLPPGESSLCPSYSQKGGPSQTSVRELNVGGKNLRGRIGEVGQKQVHELLKHFPRAKQQSLVLELRSEEGRKVGVDLSDIVRLHEF